MLFSAVSSWRGTKAESLSLAYGFIKASDNPQMNIDELMIAVDKEMYKNKRDYYVKNGLSGRF